MTLLASVYCSDEDVAVRAPGDFPVLVPKDQVLAKGSDGAFAPGVPWVLVSATNDFAAQGVTPGCVVLLSKPAVSFGAPGWILAVESVGPGSVTLRPKGSKPTTGYFPSRAAGITGVEFSVPSLAPQIEEASDDLNRLLGINELVVNRGATSLQDLRELRQATVLTVLFKLYFDASRQAGQKDDFLAKAEMIRQERTDLLDRLVIHWQSITSAYGGAAEAATTRFGTRLSR